MASFAQLQQEGLCLRFPENITPQREVTYESAVNMLLRGAAMAPNVPFSWSFIDKPSGPSLISNCQLVTGFVFLIYICILDGTLLLLFLSPNSPFPSDGIRYQDAEAKYTIPAGARVNLPFSCTVHPIHTLTPSGTRNPRGKVWLYTQLSRRHCVACPKALPTPERRKPPTCPRSLYTRSSDARVFMSYEPFIL